MPRRFRSTDYARFTGAALLIVAAAGTAAAQAARPTGTVIVSNMNDHTATLIDAATGRVLATLPTGEGPHEVAASHDGKWALVSNYGVRGKAGHTITVIDVANAAVAKTIDLGDAGRPHGMSFLPGDTVVAVTSEANRNVHLVDVRSGTLIKSLPTGGRTSHMLSVSASGDRIVTGNISDGTISVLSLGGEPKTIPVARQPEGIAITPDGNEAWVGSNRDSLVSVVDLRTGEAKAILRGFGLPYRLAVSRDGKSVVITDPVTGKVSVFDAATRKARFTIDVPRDSIVSTAEVPGSPSPEGVVISPDSRWAFVTLQGRNRMVTIDLTRGAIVGWAVTGTWSDGIAYSPLLARPK
jgi:DNA-binding beta-propeller fold protein YncE